jgi:multiple sugar transport system ATP-binding protein
MRKTPGDEVRRRVAEVADLLGIGEILDRRPGTLSGGQQQRVALGRAMVRRPSVYLFDEPLASLDAPLRARTRVELKRMKRSVPMSGLYVTHDQQEAMSLGDRIAVMKDGRLRQLGSPREVYDSPADRFVAGFFGATSMNFLEGSLRQSGGETTLEGRGWRLLAPSSLLDRIRTGLDDGVGRSVVLGVRPEDVRIRTNGGDGGAFGVSAALEMTETLGGSELAYLRLEDGQRIVAFASLEGLNGLGASSGTAGDSVRVDVEMRRAAFFEPGPSGVNLTRTSES